MSQESIFSPNIFGEEENGKNETRYITLAHDIQLGYFEMDHISFSSAQIYLDASREMCW